MNQEMPCLAAVLPVATLVQMTGERAMSLSVSIGPETPRSRRRVRLGSAPVAARASITFQSAPSMPITTARVSRERAEVCAPQETSSASARATASEERCGARGSLVRERGALVMASLPRFRRGSVVPLLEHAQALQLAAQLGDLLREARASAAVVLDPPRELLELVQQHRAQEVVLH